MQRTVRYCYRCGRRLTAGREQCWYCGAPTQREIRPPRTCPFCRQTVPHDALKCNHCGEWIDGRPNEPAAPRQVVYVIDKNLLEAARDCRLLAGQSVPPDIANRLLPNTVRAIEHNQPELIAQPGVRALPAPADVMDVELEPASRMRAALPDRSIAGALPDRSAGLPARTGEAGRDGKSDLPVLRDQTPDSVAARLGLQLGHALGAAGRWLVRTAPGSRPRPVKQTIDAAVEDPFRICERCGTEILSSDAYCYHCGMQYRFTPADERRRARRFAFPAALAIYGAVLVMLGIMIVLQIKLPSESRPAMAKPLLAAAAGLLCLIGFFHRRSSLNQIVAIVLALATVAVYLIF